jgi:hypothetical protein
MLGVCCHVTGAKTPNSPSIAFHHPLTFQQLEGIGSARLLPAITVLGDMTCYVAPVTEAGYASCIRILPYVSTSH